MANTNINQGMERGEYRGKELEFSSYCSGAAPVFESNATNTGSTMNTKHTAMELTGSPYGEGLVYSFTCAGAITGGQLVQASGGVIVASAALKNVTGVAYGSALYASGTAATISVMVYGLKYLTCADTVANGDYVIAGSVAHTIQSGAASAAAFGKCLKAGASGGTALVMVGKL